MAIQPGPLPPEPNLSRPPRNLVLMKLTPGQRALQVFQLALLSLAMVGLSGCDQVHQRLKAYLSETKEDKAGTSEPVMPDIARPTQKADPSAPAPKPASPKAADRQADARDETAKGSVSVQPLRAEPGLAPTPAQGSPSQRFSSHQGSTGAGPTETRRSSDAR